MAVHILNYPEQWSEEHPIPPSYMMVLNDYFVIENIQKDESLEIQLPPVLRMRPIPVRGLLCKLNFVAVNMCDQEAFKLFYISVMGKNIKMLFESNLYYGYLSDVVYGHEDVSFSFTYVSKVRELTPGQFIGPYTL